MNEKEKLLTIGHMSKLTGVGIKALRHYDKIGVLKPAYVDPFTGYRYYSFSQTYIVGLIKSAVELDIPLKSLTDYISDDGTMDFEAFVAKGNEVVQAKMKTLENAVKFFDFFEENIKLHENHKLQKPYTRNIEKKFFYILPYQNEFSDEYDVSDLTQFLDMTFDYLDTGESSFDWADYGYILKYSPQGKKRYVFKEAPHNILSHNKNYPLMEIPEGLYHCKQSQDSQIEDAAEIFKDYLAGNESYIAIETEIICGKFNINHPINELRVMSVPL